MAIVRGEVLLMGKLNSDGEFRLEKEGRFGGFRGGPNGHRVLNGGSETPTRVYELRHGMLIPGHITAGGPFIPEPGRVIIRFTDYRYRPDGIKIWNLPGVFVTEEEAAKMKRAKPADMK